MKLWDFKAGIYHFWRSFFPINLIWRAEQKAIQELFQQGNQATQRILDVGCGVSNNLPQVSNFVVQVDLSWQMLQQIRRRHSSLNRLTLLVQADTTRLPFRSQAFDTLLCIGVTEYISDKATLLNELHRVLIPKGRMLITVSPRHPLNYLRFLLGHRLYLISAQKITQLLQRSHFCVLATHRTLIQQQFWAEAN